LIGSQDIMEVEKSNTNKNRLEQAKKIISNAADSLIIASKYEPSAVFFELFPHLALSRPFVIFSSLVQPLAECYDKVLIQKNSYQFGFK